MRPIHIDNLLRQLEGIVALIGFTETVEADVAAFVQRNAGWADYINEQVDRLRETAPCGYDWQERLEKLQQAGEVTA